MHIYLTYMIDIWSVDYQIRKDTNLIFETHSAEYMAGKKCRNPNG